MGKFCNVLLAVKCYIHYVRGPGALGVKSIVLNKKRLEANPGKESGTVA